MSVAAAKQQASCAAEELAAGAMVGLTVGSLPVVVVRTPEGELHAFVDRCIHQAARVSRGRLRAGTDGDEPGEYRLLEGQSVVKCPWHGYEYDARTGCALFDPRRRLRRVAVEEIDGRVVVTA